ncbi:MAG: hypothetical protein GXO33_00025 [Epsilonproteobacteria bacterium]|nr:hypothetical protein [Campylobacterota bacterium]
MADEIRLACPFDREGQILGFYATVGLWALMLYAVWRNVGIDAAAWPLFWWLVLMAVVVFGRKLWTFWRMDGAALDEKELRLCRSGRAVERVALDDVGLRIGIDIRGRREVTVYDLRKRRLLFVCKEGEAKPEALESFVTALLERGGGDGALYKEGTYGEVVPLGGERPVSAGFVQKRYYFGHLGYGWVPYLVAALAAVGTLYVLGGR